MRIIYPIVHALFYAFSLLPFRVLYAISDVFFVLVYYIVGYRKRVVRRNLESSFPEKDTNELRSIERGFYHFFCDYLVETIKLLSISREKMLKHFEIRGAEEVEKCFDEGQTCAGILGHYCNWEYLSATGLAFHRYPEAVTSARKRCRSSDISPTRHPNGTISTCGFPSSDTTHPSSPMARH